MNPRNFNAMLTAFVEDYDTRSPQHAAASKWMDETVSEQIVVTNSQSTQLFRPCFAMADVYRPGKYTISCYDHDSEHLRFIMDDAERMKSTLGKHHPWANGV